MKEVDLTLMIVIGYITVAGLGSYIFSILFNKSSRKPAKNIEKVIPSGKEAHCLVCNRYFADDKAFQEHRDGKPHNEKLKSYRGEEYRIQPRKTIKR